jgi:hypothetical protein
MDGEPERWGPVNRKIHKVIDLPRLASNDAVLEQALNYLNVLNPALAGSGAFTIDQEDSL